MFHMPSLILLSILFTTPAFSQAGNFDHVVVVVFENSKYKEVLKDSNFKNIAKHGVLLENMHAVTHPSQGNYIALISGSTHGVQHDNPVTLDSNHIGDLLENKGLSWKVYAENYPGNCYLKKSYGNYVRKHVPFLSFRNVSENADRCKNIQDASQFDADLNNHTLPNFSLYVPNNLHNGHDTNIKTAGKWLANNFEPLLNSSFLEQKILFIITFDEDDFTEKNQIFSVLIHPKITKNSKNNQNVNHYSMLKLIEDELKIGNLNYNDANATAFADLWE